ncbi:hypothetical protein BDY19DRAFT_998728 [Irpex rosettiformis]|uniref:Uncharacterized protein n=1 Tax=Irpex rosettiformis TaxID=378272 RepID=A0ACB8TMN0_9APHY|nr:hypothetical protein BDY19DRAFT_998728 [Irpex rosettiformis]
MSQSSQSFYTAFSSGEQLTPPNSPSVTLHDDDNDSDGREFDELASDLGLLGISEPAHVRPLTPPQKHLHLPDEMLHGPYEIPQSWEVPLTATVLSLREVWCVFHGRTTGVFTDWPSALTQVAGLHHQVQARYDNIYVAARIWREACLAGIVVNPLHSHSIWPKVVSDKELQRRADVLNALYGLVDPNVADGKHPYTPLSCGSAYNRMTPGTSESNQGDPPTPAPMQNSSRSTTPVPCSQDGHKAGQSENGRSRVSSWASSVSETTTTTSVSSEDGDERPRMKVDPNRMTDDGPIPSASAFKDKGKDGIPTPVARGFVVIKGRRPGIYYDESTWRSAQADRGWAMLCSTVAKAEALFVLLENQVEFLN